MKGEEEGCGSWVCVGGDSVMSCLTFGWELWFDPHGVQFLSTKRSFRFLTDSRC